MATQMSAEGHDVTIIDSNPQVLSESAERLDIMAVIGNGASMATLRSAGVEKADVLIAATSRDELNLLTCLTAKKLGAKRTIARVRNPEYSDQLVAMQEELGLSMTVNPEQAAAQEAYQLLQFPSFLKRDSFARGRVELVSFTVQEGDFLAGRTLASLSSKIQGLPMLLCTVERGDEVFIPNGASLIRAGDRVSIAGTPSGINQFFKLLGRQTHRIRDVFIIGGGRIAFYLLVQLERLGMSCKVVEKGEERCRELAEEFPHSLVIHGDGTDPELLTEERMASSDAFVALTDRDEDNLIISLYAHQAGVPKVVAKSSRQNYTAIARSAGVESVVSPKLATVGLILRFIRGLQNSKGTVMNALYRIAGGRAEAMEFIVSSATRNLGVALKELRLRKGILIAVIVRGNHVIIPEGSTCLEQGDDVIVIARDSGILDLNDIYEGGGV